MADERPVFGVLATCCLILSNGVSEGIAVGLDLWNCAFGTNCADGVFARLEGRWGESLITCLPFLFGVGSLPELSASAGRVYRRLSGDA